MKFKNKGRKIYKTKEKNYYEKSKSSKLMSFCLSILLIGGVGFIGYSFAEPLLNYTKKQGDEVFSTSQPSTTDNTETTFQPSESVSNIDSTENLTPTENSKLIYNCKSLKTDDLKNIESLKMSLASIKSSNAEYVLVPLKVEGGRIYYFTDEGTSYLAGAVESQFTLDNILSEINDAGLKAIGYFSVLNDNLYPATYSDTAYKFEDGSSIWIDDNYEDGGKPWLSPFANATWTYIETLVSEITLSGFEKIVYSDISFPNFRESDLNYLGEIVKSSDRYTALTTIANKLYSLSLNNDTSSMIEVSAADIIADKAEILQPMILSVSTIVVDINFDELAGFYGKNDMFYEITGTPDKIVTETINAIKNDVSEFNVVVRISGENISDLDFEKAKDTLIGLGYQSYILG